MSNKIPSDTEQNERLGQWEEQSPPWGGNVFVAYTRQLMLIFSCPVFLEVATSVMICHKVL